MNQIRGIAGVAGRTPIGAAITVSRRDRPNGHPTHKDGFWILNSFQTDGKRDMHPGYSMFNSAPAEQRQTLHGYLVHETEEKCFEHHRKAQRLPGLSMHPHKRPHCIGDGVKAIRWTGNVRIDDDTNDFVEMQCLGNRCEFAQGQPPPCRPWMRVVFLLTHWGNGQSLPGVLAKFTSGGWQTYQNFLGFFEQIQTAAQQIGIENPNLTGYPLTLHHLYKTKPEKRIKYQVIEVYPRKSPYEFLAEQTKLIKSIRSEYGELEAITDQTQQQPQVVFEDQKSIEWPRSKEQ